MDVDLLALLPEYIPHESERRGRITSASYAGVNEVMCYECRRIELLFADVTTEKVRYVKIGELWYCAECSEEEQRR